jgi:hypothetical protein
MSTRYPTTGICESGIASTPSESSVSAASWSAIFAGAIAAAATSLILVALGSAVGLTAISPWPNSGASATTFTAMTAIWLIVVQWVSSLMGGYITGRLRTKWVGTHTLEVFFRDTAHGFVTWALATVVGAIILTSVAGAASGKVIQGASTIAAGAAQGAASSVSSSAAATTNYDLDRLLRPANVAEGSSKAEWRGEVASIITKGLSAGEVPPDDRDYVTKLVAAHAGISDAKAHKRVDQVIATEKDAQRKAREAADDARKAAASASIFMALSMLIGAFISPASAALGGRLRDLHP